MANNVNTEFIEDQIDQKSKILNWKKLREIYKPKKINILLIGEAPPDSGSSHNFYQTSPLTEYTREAFQQSFSKIKSNFTNEEFLHYFKLLGCFFEYIGKSPVLDSAKAHEEAPDGRKKHLRPKHK